ncbi:MAG: C1 family peptidase [Terriglobia bacterium]
MKSRSVEKERCVTTTMLTTPKPGKGLGRKLDKPDGRDLVLAVPPHLGINAPLPSRVDVFAGLSLPVYDQGSLGSCTANAGVLYRRFLAQRFAKYSAPDEDLSRLFLYYQERKLSWNNDVALDSGAAVRDIFYVLAHTGVCAAIDDPYVVAEFASAWNDTPPEVVSAERYRIGAYHRVPDKDTARACLASGYAIVLGFTVYESFGNIGSDGVMTMPAAAERVIGGHAVVIRGYDEGNSEFLLQNSWGSAWGMNGCFRMPFAFIENTALSQPDMWIGHLGKPWRPN